MERFDVRSKLITVLLISITAGAASARTVGSSGEATDRFQFNSTPLDGGEDGSFVDPDSIQRGRDDLFRKLDLLLRADSHTSEVTLGADPDVKFTQSRAYDSGLPLPVGLSYRKGHQRVVFFGELVPILDPTADSPLGWGGGIGIRIYLGRQ